MKAILVDDEASNLENIHTLLQRYCPHVQVVGMAATVEEATRLILHLNVDLVLLDIQMGKESGFDLLRLTPDKSFEVIFITAYDQYGIQAIKFAALDYLLKPVDIEELIQAVQKASVKLSAKRRTEQLDFLLQHLSQSPALPPVRIALPQQQEIRYVVVSDIIRCEADNTYTRFYITNNDKILVSGTLKEYTEMLQQHGFLRTHQTHLVNPAFIKSWLKEDGGVLLLTTGERIPISKPRRDVIKEALKKGSNR